jgi:mono/diheme cytochrome c family protein
MDFTLRKISLLAVLVATGVTVATAQQTQIKKERIKQSSPASGEVMYKQYCAVCHGTTGKGDGPAVPALKTPPPDLTTLAKRNNGKYPDDRVTSVLKFGTKTPAHGSSEMPIWGPAFQSLKKGDTAIATMRITNLSSYIKSLQEK